MKREQVIPAKSSVKQTTPIVQMQLAPKEKVTKELVQTEREDIATPEINPGIDNRIQSLAGGGKPLPTSARSFFEDYFGTDFRDVHIHTGSKAAQLTHAFNAKAFTFNRNIVVDPVHYSPETIEGRRILAHELVHVLQQGSRRSNTIRRLVDPNRSACTAGQGNAPQNALDILRLRDFFARLDLLNFVIPQLEIEVRQLNAGISTNVMYEYFRWFGRPPQRRGQYVNRFQTTRRYSNFREAVAAELRCLLVKYRRMEQKLASPIAYMCWNVCRDSPYAETVTSTKVKICPPFWTTDHNEQALTIIHEAAHMIGVSSNRGRGHPTRIVDRPLNAFCYENLAASLAPHRGHAPGYYGCQATPRFRIRTVY
jgi:hypothetical protein